MLSFIIIIADPEACQTGTNYDRSTSILFTFKLFYNSQPLPVSQTSRCGTYCTKNLISIRNNRCLCVLQGHFRALHNALINTRLTSAVRVRLGPKVHAPIHSLRPLPPAHFLSYNKSRYCYTYSSNISTFLRIYLLLISLK